MYIRLEDFSGLAPKYSKRKLKANWASEAIDAQLYSGELRGLKSPEFLQALLSNTKKVFRIYNTDTFLEFDRKEASCVRGQVTGDQYDRYYWTTGNSAPYFGPTAVHDDLLQDEPTNPQANGYKLGVPAPGTALTVVPSGGTSTVRESRAYVYTYVNEFGDESAPSEPSVVVTGAIDDAWELSNFVVDTQTGYAAITSIRIYRTVTGQTSVDYRYVDEITVVDGLIDPAAQVPYDDTLSPDEISLNDPIPSIGWLPPPDNLDGLINMPNGMMAGFKGKDIYISEPYRPHAFPVENIITVDADVVGLGVHNSGLVVCTNSNPYVISGTAPLNLSAVKLDEVEPCQGRYSIASAQQGVYYASQNGLVLISESTAEVITKPLMTRNEWRSLYTPENINAAVLGMSYLGFYSSSQGFIIGPESGEAPLVNLASINQVATVQTDAFSAEVILIRQAALYQWNPTKSAPFTFSWKSKQFETPKPVNMGALMVKWYPSDGTDGGFVPTTDYSEFNQYLIDSFELNTLNLAPINQVANQDMGGTEVPPTPTYSGEQPKWAINPTGFDPYMGVSGEVPPLVKTSINGSLLQPANPLNIFDGVNIRIWGDGILRYENVINDERQHRLPSGYKASIWEIQIQSSENVYSVAIAETGKELAET